jgi:SAM-dependent methyltransferase
MDIRELAPGLTVAPEGYWLMADGPTPSYPETGHGFCLAVEENSFWFAHRSRAITAAVRRYPPPPGPILDVGAGNGFVSAAIEQAGFPTVAVEPSRTGAQNALDRGLAHVVCGTLPSPAFRPRIAGAIGLFDVIEHIEDDVRFLSSLRPYLAEKGRLYVTVPAYQWLWSANDVRSGHFRRYTRRSLSRVLEAAGYRMEYATYIFWALPVPILLCRTVRGSATVSDARVRSQHRAGGVTFRRLIAACFSFEVGLISRGVSMPFGGSCLAVASSRS